MRKTRILLVESNLLYAAGIRLFLERKNMAVTTVSSELSAPREFRQATHTAFSIVIIGTTRPTRSTHLLIRSLREIHWFVPIMVLSDTENFKHIKAFFQSGADDYQPRDILHEILWLRIMVLLKRSLPRFAGQREVYQIGQLRFDVRSRILSNEDLGYRATIREQEAKVLEYLAIYQGKTVLKKELQRNIWGNGTDYFISRALSVHINKLRKVLNGKSGARLEILPNVGYRISVDRP